MAKKRRTAPPPERRRHCLNVLLNDREYKAILNHCSQHHITNRSSWLRSVIISEVLREHERNAPMLFGEEEMC